MLLLATFETRLVAQNNDLSVISLRGISKDSFSISLKNSNTVKKIFCKQVYIPASIAEKDQCGTNEVWSDGFHYDNLTLQPSQELAYPETGKAILKDIRARSANLLGPDSQVVYEFCDLRNSTLKDCGYTCNDGDVEKNYGDTYTLTANNATVRKTCKADGTLEIIEANCSDAERYVISSDRTSCSPRSCGARSHGEEWNIPVENGVQVHACSFGSETVARTDCNSAAFAVVNGYCRANPIFTRYKANELVSSCGSLSTKRDIFKPYAPFIESYLTGRLPNGTSGVVAPSCKANDFLLSTLNFASPASGSVKVTFHFAMNFNGVPSTMSSDTPMAEFELYSASYNGMVFQKKQITFGDLSSTAFIAGDDSTIDNIAALPPKSLNPGIYNWKMISLDGFLPQAISDLTPRIKILNNGTAFRLAGVDIQFVPSP